MATKVTGVRLKPETLEHLDELSKISGMNRSQFLTVLIDAEHDRVMGNPKLKAVLAQMDVLRSQLADLSGHEAGNALMVSDKA